MDWLASHMCGDETHVCMSVCFDGETIRIPAQPHSMNSLKLNSRSYAYSSYILSYIYLSNFWMCVPFRTKRTKTWVYSMVFSFRLYAIRPISLSLTHSICWLICYTWFVPSEKLNCARLTAFAPNLFFGWGTNNQTGNSDNRRSRKRSFLYVDDALCFNFNVQIRKILSNVSKYCQKLALSRSLVQRVRKSHAREHIRTRPYSYNSYRLLPSLNALCLPARHYNAWRYLAPKYIVYSFARYTATDCPVALTATIRGWGSQCPICIVVCQIVCKRVCEYRRSTW